MNIFLNSLPKSGTNLVQKCLELCSINYSDRSVAASSAYGRFSFAKQLLRGPWLSGDPVDIGLEVPSLVSDKWLSGYLSSAEGYVSGHAAFSKRLHEILCDQDYRVIQVVRHPCAVLTSWANYIVEPGYYWDEIRQFLVNKTFEERVRFLIYGGPFDGGSLYYRGLREVLSKGQDWYDSANVLIVRFEDLVGSKGGGSNVAQRVTISKILNHIGKELEDDELDYIQANLFGGTHTFRSGQIDSWRELLDEDLEKSLIDEIESTLYFNRLGYKSDI